MHRYIWPVAALLAGFSGSSRRCEPRGWTRFVSSGVSRRRRLDPSANFGSGPARRRVLFASTAVVVAMATATGPPVGLADDPPACPSSTDAAYAMTARALTGPARTDLTLRFTAGPTCAAVTMVKHVQVKTFTETGKVADVVNLDDVSAQGGAASVELGRVERGRRIEADATVQTGTPPRTYVLREATTSLLRPDLAVRAHAPVQTLTTRPITVTAEVSELKGDTGATAEVALAGPIGPLADPVEVTVPAGGKVDVTFPNIALTSSVPVELTVIVRAAAPAEYDAADDANDTQSATIEVTKNELARSRLLVDSLGGYGFQFNHHLYAPITNPAPETLPNLEAKVKALEPQFVRIFYSENWEANADGTHATDWPANLDSFKRVVALANEAGPTIVIAYQSTTFAKTNPTLWMSRFADVLQDLIVNRGLTNVRWVTIGNEPNTVNKDGIPTITLPQYEALYRALDAELRARGLRTQVGLIGGDLVQNTEDTANGHRAWFDYMVTHMNDVLDAWSEHIYWNYDGPRRMEERLKDVAYLVHQELPEAARKPTFLMEYGVRGYTSCGTKPNLKNAYYLPDCSDLRRMPLAAFHKLAFVIESAQLGFDAVSNWDLYWSTYDRTKANQSFWMIGPPEEGWALYPSYYAFQLLLQTTARGWQVIGVDPWTAADEAEPIARQTSDPPTWIWDQSEQELTGYSGPDGQLTIVGLDTNGRALVAPNDVSSEYSIGGLPPYTTFTLALWNATGDGTNSVAQTITTGAAGVARFSVPLQAAFVLTTVPVS